MVLALGLMVTHATAAGKPDPYAFKVESPFKGVVSTITASSITVKGEVQMPNADKTSSKSKPNLQNVRFSTKGAKLTRDGKPCEVKDVQKGDSVVVDFAPKADSDKRVASELRFSSKGSAADTETKPDKAEKAEPKAEKKEKKDKEKKE